MTPPKKNKEREINKGSRYSPEVRNSLNTIGVPGKSLAPGVLNSTTFSGPHIELLSQIVKNTKRDLAKEHF